MNIRMLSQMIINGGDDKEDLYRSDKSEVISPVSNSPFCIKMNQHYGHENKGNDDDRQLQKFLTVKLILGISTQYT